MLFQTADSTHRQRAYTLASPPTLNERDPGLYLARMERVTRLGNHSRTLRPNHFALLVMEAGKLAVESREQYFELSKGDLFAIFPKAPVRYRDLVRRRGRHTLLAPGGSQTGDAFAELGLTVETPLLRGEFDRPLEPLIKKVEVAYEHNRHDQLFPTLVAWEMIGIIAANAHEEKPASKGPHGVADAAHHILDREFPETITIEQVAQRLGVTRSTVFRHFKEAFGLSPKEYLNDLRLERARRLLEDGRASIKEVAHRSGFETAHHFGRAFHRHFGASPTKYAEKHRAK
jgi:AraC-like DNA-binding protein